jgi:hypothetical protein
VNLVSVVFILREFDFFLKKSKLITKLKTDNKVNIVNTNLRNWARYDRYIIKKV